MTGPTGHRSMINNSGADQTESQRHQIVGVQTIAVCRHMQKRRVRASCCSLQDMFVVSVFAEADALLACMSIILSSSFGQLLLFLPSHDRQ